MSFQPTPLVKEIVNDDKILKMNLHEHVQLIAYLTAQLEHYMQVQKSKLKNDEQKHL